MTSPPTTDPELSAKRGHEVSRRFRERGLMLLLPLLLLVASGGAAWGQDPAIGISVPVTLPDRYGLQAAGGGGSSVKTPAYCDAQGNFLPGVPWCLFAGRPVQVRKGVREFCIPCGTTSPVLAVANIWTENLGASIGVSLAGTEEVPDFSDAASARLARIWTYDGYAYLDQLQREFLIPEAESGNAGALHTFDMLADAGAANPPRWTCLAGYLFTPPPGGFKKSFKATFIAQMVRKETEPVSGGTVIHLISQVAIPVTFTVVPEATRMVAVSKDAANGHFAITWRSNFTSYQVEWTDDLLNGPWRGVYENAQLTGIQESTMTWVDDGSRTAPLVSGKDRFYRVLTPEPDPE